MSELSTSAQCRTLSAIYYKKNYSAEEITDKIPPRLEVIQGHNLAAINTLYMTLPRQLVVTHSTWPHFRDIAGSLLSIAS